MIELPDNGVGEDRGIYEASFENGQWGQVLRVDRTVGARFNDGRESGVRVPKLSSKQKRGENPNLDSQHTLIPLDNWSINLYICFHVIKWGRGQNIFPHFQSCDNCPLHPSSYTPVMVTIRLIRHYLTKTIPIVQRSNSSSFVIN